MTIKICIEISGETPDELTDKMYALTQRFNAIQLGGVPDEDAPAPKPTPKPAAAAKPTAKPAAAAAPKTPAKPAPKKPAEDALPDYAADVAPLVLRVANEVSRDACLEVLGAFDVKKATELSPDQYKDFIDALNAKLAENDLV